MSEELSNSPSGESLCDKKRKIEENRKILPRDARSTSSWTERITKLMKIEVKDSNIFSESDLTREDETDPIYLNFITDKTWKSEIEIDGLPVDDDFKTLVFEIKRVYDANNKLSEYYVDTYVHTLLFLLGMNRYPLTINPKHRLVTKIGIKREKITSEPDFLVKCEKSKMLTIVEDKRLDNVAYVNQWKENQVLGEIFSAAHDIDFESKCEVYGVRVIGTLFTFYKGIVTKEYIKESLLCLPTKNCMDVYRYPNPGDNVHIPNALDLCKLEDRKIIIMYLKKIKSILLSGN